MTGSHPGRADVIEFRLLCGWLFLLPLFEAPKHLLWAGWVVAWLVAHGPRVALARPRGGLEWSLVAMALTAVAAGITTPAWGQSLSASGDLLRLALTAWLVSRAGLAPGRLLVALAFAVGGALTALAWGLAVLFAGEGGKYLELHSVGHVNHSAIYLAIALAAALGLGVAARERAAVRRDAGLAVIALATGLWISASRAAVGATLVFAGWLAAFPPPSIPTIGRRRMRIALLAGVAASVLAFGAIRLVSPVSFHPPGGDMSAKFDSRLIDAGLLAFRVHLWRVAALAAAAEPLTGIGNRQFRNLTPERVCEARPRLPRAWLPDPCDASKLYFKPHAHSLYAQALAERGIAGALATAAVVVAWGALLIRAARSRRDAAFDGIVCASLGAWCVTAFAGLLNTTLQHEHGLLAMTLLGALAGVNSGRVSAPDGANADPIEVG